MDVSTFSRGLHVITGIENSTDSEVVYRGSSATQHPLKNKNMTNLQGSDIMGVICTSIQASC